MGRKLCVVGFTDAEMADFFGVSERTVNTWKKAHPEFLQSITRGKILADANVAEALYKRAAGYSHPAVKIFNNNGAPMRVEYTEHYPPDTAACSLWLRNRQPTRWRDKQAIEHGGNVSTIRRIERVIVDPDGRVERNDQDKNG
jgi:hypothetical protein